MRYSRLVPKIEKGGVVKSRVIRSKPKPTRTHKATKAATKSARKRKSRIDDSSESAGSSDDDGRESESEVKSKDEDVGSLPKLRTRGVKRLMREASSSDSEDSPDDVSDSDIDDYKPTGEEDADDEDTLSNIEETPKGRIKSDSNDEAGRNRRSGTPPVTPGRLTDSSKHTSLPITPPRSDEKQSKFTSAIPSPTLRTLDYDHQIKQDLHRLEGGNDDAGQQAFQHRSIVSSGLRPKHSICRDVRSGIRHRRVDRARWRGRLRRSWRGRTGKRE